VPTKFPPLVQNAPLVSPALLRRGNTLLKFKEKTFSRELFIFSQLGVPFSSCIRHQDALRHLFFCVVNRLAWFLHVCGP
jgi:hypothetical protein